MNMSLPRITYVGNFLSRHGLNPTHAEALVPQLEGFGLSVRPVSHHLNPVLRLTDILFNILFSPKSGSVVMIDLFSGPRAFEAAFLISLTCRLAGKPYLLVLRGGGLPGRLLTSRTRLLFILEGARQIVSPSKFLAERFSPYVHVEVIPNGLALADYPYRLRASPRPRILFLRAYHQVYDPITVIKAFSLVNRVHPDAHLRMIGPDADGTLSECQALVKGLNLESNVELSGRIQKSEIPKVGGEYDIFVNSSVVDNTPVSTIEAMAMGMCIVSTTAGGMPYLLKNGETALLVPPSDEEQMAGAMLRILQDPSLAEHLSRNARSAVEFWDWSHIIPRWLEVFQSVLGNTP